MSRKGRRGRSKKMSARPKAAAVVRVEESPASLPPGAAGPAEARTARTESTPPERRNDAPEPAGPSVPPPVELSAMPPAEPSVPPPPAEPSVMPPVEPIAALPVEAGTGQTVPTGPIPCETAAEGEPQPEPPEPSVPPVGDLDARWVEDLDARFFVESSSEAWLAYELELRDPRLLRKMTASMARRRAHLARYVAGVVGVAVVLCLAALVKSAVPVADEASPPRSAAQMGMPAGQAASLPLPAAASAEPAARADGVDGGGD